MAFMWWTCVACLYYALVSHSKTVAMISLLYATFLAFLHATAFIAQKEIEREERDRDE